MRDAFNDSARLADDLLEPNSGRPGREPLSPRPAVDRRPARERATERSSDTARSRPGSEAVGETDIKTSFIAAARRAAQAAQAELAAEEPSARRDLRATKASPPPSAASGPRP